MVILRGVHLAPVAQGDEDVLTSHADILGADQTANNKKEKMRNVGSSHKNLPNTDPGGELLLLPSTPRTSPWGLPQGNSQIF